MTAQNDHQSVQRDIADRSALRAASYFAGRTSPVLEAELLAQERILVTGGSGFIGTNLIDFYRQAGARHVFNLDVAAPRNPAQESHWLKADLRDASAVAEVVAKVNPSVVFHLGARTDLDGTTLEDYAANTDGVAHVIAAVNALPRVPRTIFMSSRFVCNIHYTPTHDEDYAPVTVYGESKVETERIVRAVAGNRLPWVIVRPTSIWGPWFDIPYKGFFDAVRRRYYVHPKGRRIVKSYGFVGNAVFQLDRLMYKSFQPARAKTFYLCDYPPLEILSWSRMIAQTFAVRPPIEVPLLPLSLLAWGGDLAKKAGMRNPPLTSFRLDNLITQMPFDTRPIESFVGPLPFSLQEAVQITCDWMAAHEKALAA